MENFNELNSESDSIRELYIDILNNKQKLLIRMAKNADKDAFRDLWNICFNDTKPFVSWFFENRFFPEYSVCIEMDGKIICAMQSIKVPIWIREESIPGAIVAGVCTHPDFRGHHLMKSMFSFYIEQMKKLGILAITYKPENFNTYHSLGHFPSTNTIWYDTKIDGINFGARDLSEENFPQARKDENTQFRVNHPVNQEMSYINSNKCNNTDEAYTSIYNDKDDKNEISNLKGNEAKLSTLYNTIENSNFKICQILDMIPFDMTKCFDLYSKIAYSYSGMVDRDFELFKLKANDYSCVGGNIAILYTKNIIRAYCFYFDMENVIYGEEFIAIDFASANILINHLKNLFKNKKLKIKLQSDFTDFFKQKTNPDVSENDILPGHICDDENRKNDDVPIKLNTDYFVEYFDLTNKLYDNSNKIDAIITPLNERKITPKLQFYNVKMIEQNVLGVTKVSDFIRCLCLSKKTDSFVLESLIVETFDNVVESNNITFNLLGAISHHQPFMKINTGTLVQILCGYKSLYEVIAMDCEKAENEKLVIIYNSENILRFDKILPKRPCFIVDEY